MLLRALGFVAAFVGTHVLAAPTAAACSPSQVPPPEGVIYSVRPATDTQTQESLPIPKDGSIVLEVYAGKMTDDEFRSKVRVTVEADGGALEGALVRRLDLSQGRSVWLWKPVAELPVTPLALRIDVPATGAREPSARYVVPVANETFVLPKLPIDVTVSRAALPDGSSPQIRCGHMMASSCGPRSEEEVTYATRWVGLPNVAHRTEDVRERKELAFVRGTVRIYSRDAQGNVSQQSERDLSTSASGETLLGRPDAQYCASVTTVSLFDETREATTETCIPHGALDLAVRADEEETRVRDSIKSCKTPVYPEGYSADHPAGHGDAGGGCGVTARKPSASLAGVVAFAVSVLALRRRRRSDEGASPARS